MKPENQDKMWEIAKKRYPSVGGYNGYDNPNGGNSGSGAHGSDHHMEPKKIIITREEMLKILGPH